MTNELTCIVNLTKKWSYIRDSSLVMKLTVLLVILILSLASFSQEVSGIVKDDKGSILPNASIHIRGTTEGCSANNEGKYSINLSPGNYTLICQHVGFKRDVRNIVVTNADQTLDFELKTIDFTLEEVIVRSGENPANDIIRKTIEKRPFYQKQLDKFRCEVYTKGILRLRDYPKKILGQKIDFGDGDTSKQKIVYLSETIATYSVEKQRNTKTEVISSKVSGDGDGYGLAAPKYYSFYENNVKLGDNSLNPRGFISPISDNAMHYYRYKYEGAFFEEGIQVSRIRVIPKRKYEPLFSGHINIVENDWRIHSLQLELTKESQMELLDTLKLEQIYVPANKDVWVIQSQVVYPSVKLFGIDAYGSFVNIYSKFEIAPEFGRKYFDNTILVYHDSSRRKTNSYWEDARPMRLMNEEINDYMKKDSIEQISKSPAYLDSVDRENNKISLLGLALTGVSFSKEKRRETYSFRSLTDIISFNIVEGLVINLAATYSKRLDTLIGRRELRITPNLRFGFGNKHFNAHTGVTYIFGKRYFSSVNFSGGRRVYQFNNASPISNRSNTISTLIGEKNTLKLYEAWFGQGSYTQGIGEGFTWSVGFQYQDRSPLENITDYTWRDRKDKVFTPNYPTELMPGNITRHQAFSINFGITWQPGARYWELPDQKINIGSRWPVMSLVYIHGLKDVFGSDIDYSKWRFTLSDLFNLRLAGVFNYRLGVGGFIKNDSVAVPDYQHFNGNISKFAAPYLNSFQILPIYQYSNTNKFYTLAHFEHHFNGFLTNKIPLFRKLNWYLVGGVNTFYINKNNRYFEVMGGLENIFKIIRIDYVRSTFAGTSPMSNFRIGLKGRIGKSDD